MMFAHTFTYTLGILTHTKGDILSMVCTPFRGARERHRRAVLA